MGQTEVLTGTSGFSYKEWKGTFYPDDLANSEMLAFYSERLPAVEINNTFYRLPRKDVLESWAQSVPDSFRFVIKASRRITHFKRLKAPFDEVDYLLEATLTIGDKLGAILFQLPPNMKKDTERLTAFLENLPPEVPAAFEFRNDSWFGDDVYEILSQHGRALVHADTDEKPVTELTETADWGYLRLRRPGYDQEALERWATMLSGTKWKKAFAFFKHEDDGAGPEMASRFRTLTT
ncbi:MAG: DUF72 domain-containing protein [Rhodothermia bacterium]|nr:DUF72 domain-containing protein [Rhodothermia bacterium]